VKNVCETAIKSAHTHRVHLSNLSLLGRVTLKPQSKQDPPRIIRLPSLHCIGGSLLFKWHWVPRLWSWWREALVFRTSRLQWSKIIQKILVRSCCKLAKTRFFKSADWMFSI